MSRGCQRFRLYFDDFLKFVNGPVRLVHWPVWQGRLEQTEDSLGGWKPAYLTLVASFHQQTPGQCLVRHTACFMVKQWQYHKKLKPTRGKPKSAGYISDCSLDKKSNCFVWSNKKNLVFAASQPVMLMKMVFVPIWPLLQCPWVNCE